MEAQSSRGNAKKAKVEVPWEELFANLEEFVKVKVVPVINMEEYRPWSDLPSGIMESIMKRLYYIDHLHFRAACKDWNSMPKVSPLKQLPWLFLWDKSSSTSIKLIDPAYSKAYTLDMNRKCVKGKDLSDTVIHASKTSWLLLSFSKNEHDHSFFLYTPFVNNIESTIRFPNLNTKRDIEIATFSTSPPSPDCVIFILACCPASFTISTCRPGDRKWITRNFNAYSPVNDWYINAVYSDRKFYWSSYRGIGIYSIVDQEYCIVDRELCEHQNCLAHDQGYLVKSSEGEKILLILLTDATACLYCSRERIYSLDHLPMTQAENIDASSSRCHDILRLDQFQRTWSKKDSLVVTEMDSLGDQVLLIGDRGETVIVPVEDGGIKNKIYVRLERLILHFALDSSESSTLNQYDGVLDNAYQKRIWVEPPY